MTEETLTARIIEFEQHRDCQRHEVAAKFLCEARSHLRAGKTELAKRKVTAADTVPGGLYA
jgi:hypothetical protein